jgi:hypothetical protein
VGAPKAFSNHALVSGEKTLSGLMSPDYLSRSRV